MTEDISKQLDKHALGLSTAQVAGSALAAITTAVVASWAGTAGTLVGAALGSVVATVGTATYTWSIRRTSAAVRRSAAHVPIARVREERPPRWSQALPWGRIALVSAVAAVIGLAGITVVEAVSGKPVSTITGGTPGHGTTLGHVVGSDPGTTRQQPPTPSPSPSESPTPTPTPTPSPTPSPSPSEPPTVVPTTPVPTDLPPASPTG